MSARNGSAAEFDLVVLGEVLVEVTTDRAFAHGVPAELGISGDALNLAASAAAAGARVGLAAAITPDELGDAIAARVAELGVDTGLLVRRPGQQGFYLTHSDPHGEREFSYARARSVGSTLGVGDVDPAVLESAGAVAAGGIACAISETTRRLVFEAARIARRFVYDPNFRPRLTSAEQAAADLRAIARHADLVTPSHPGETRALLGANTAADAARALRDLGARRVAVTCGSHGALLADDEGSTWIDAFPAPAVIDQTGAGDAYVGTLTARLVLGDTMLDAGRLAAAAASLVVGGRGGTGIVPSLEQTREHAGTAR